MTTTRPEVKELFDTLDNFPEEQRTKAIRILIDFFNGTITPDETKVRLSMI